MKKLILLTLVSILPLIALADAVEIDGIYYNLIEKGKVAEVTKHPNKYTGDVVIPEKVTYNDVEFSVEGIGNNAFYSCSGLTSITIPNSVTSIGNLVFSGCSGLTSITIPNSVTSISGYAFSGCSSLTSITIPNSVTSISGYAFMGCSSLTSINIPNSVTSIGEYAFTYCTGLTSITIPNSITSIGSSAFFDCNNLTSVYITDLSAWCAITFQDGISNPLVYAHHLYIDGQEVKELNIPNSVTSIRKYAFSGCSGLTSITIPNSVTSISGYAFSGCSSLTSINIPNSITSIGSSAFSDCTGLTSITIPNSITSIESFAFNNCSGLTSITIPNSVKSIGQKAFADCSKVEDLYCYAERVPTTKTDAFKDSYPQYATLHVPASALNDYKATSPWNEFGFFKTIDGGEIPTNPKCAKPTISYDNFKLTYNCETEGVEYVYEIKDTDVKKGYDKEVSLSATYEISVYATKTGYDNSDVATATLVFTNATFTTVGTSSAKELNLRPLLIQANSGNINIQGAEDGARIAVYNVNGRQIGSAVSAFNTTDVSTPLKKGDVAIVKVGQRSVKVIMK